MTHAELVHRAGRWLRTSAVIPREWKGVVHRQKCRCGVALTELVTSASEIPDAIGWLNGGRHSILIECKVSRADFYADLKKRSRTESGSKYGVGVWRYYMTPFGLLQPNELPVGWGLLEVINTRIKVTHLPVRQERSLHQEMFMIWSLCRRLQSGSPIAAESTKESECHADS